MNTAESKSFSYVTSEVYNLNTKGANAYNDGYDSITRYTLDRQGKVLSKKTYADWNEMDEERYPQNYQ